METLEEIKARLEKLRDAGKDLIEEFALMLQAEKQEHARTRSTVAQYGEVLGKLNEQVVAQSRDINRQSRTINEQNTKISELEAELTKLRATTAA